MDDSRELPPALPPVPAVEQAPPPIAAAAAPGPAAPAALAGVAGSGEGGAEARAGGQHLRGQVDLGDDAARAAAALTRAAAQADREGDVAGAIATLEAATAAMPAQRELWPALAAAYARQGDLAGSSRARAQELALWPPGPERQARLLALAALEGRQGSYAGAIAALEELLAAEPASAQARALIAGLRRAALPPAVDWPLSGLLEGAQRAARAWPELAATLEARGRAHGTGPEAARAWREAAATRRDAMADPDGAFAALCAAFAADPAAPDVLAELEAAAAAARRDDGLAAALAAALPTLGDGDAAGATRAALAKALARLGRHAEAIEQIRAGAGGGLPDDPETLTTLAELLDREHRGPERALALAHLVARLPPASSPRRAATLALARLCLGPLADPAQACTALRDLLAAVPGDREALRLWAQAAQAAGQMEAELAARGALAELGADDPQLLEDLTRQGELLLALGRAEDAAAPLLAALGRRRDHPPAVAALETLADVLVDVGAIVQALEPLYVAVQDHAKLAWILSRRLSGAVDTGTRLALLRRIGELYEHHLGQPGRAFELARQALAQAPDDVGTRMWLERLAAADPAALRRLAAAYAEEAEAAPPALAAAFWRRAAAIQAERLGDLAAAAPAYRALLVHEPDDERALAALESLARATPDPAALAAVLRARLAVSVGAERRRELLAELAELQAGPLHEPEAAIASLRALLAEAPDDAAALTRLAGLHGQLGQHDREAAVYAQERARLAGRRGRDAVARRHALTLREAELRAGPLGDAAAAADLCAQVLAEDGAHAEALAFLAAAAGRGQAEPAALAAATLRRLGDWPRLAALLEQQLAVADGPEARRALCGQLAELHEQQLAAPLQALLAYARAYAEAPGDPALLTALLGVAGRHGLAEDLEAILSDSLDAIVAPAWRRTVLLRLAELCAGPLARPDAAADHLRRLLADAPADAEALAALDAVLARSEAWVALAEVLERRVEQAADAPARRALSLRLAALRATQLADPEAALRCLEPLLARVPGDAEALVAAESALRALGAWDRLADNLEAQARSQPEPEAQRRVHAALGTLLAEELGEVPAAIVAWRQVLAVAPGDPEAHQALQTLLAAEERWEELAQLLRAALASSTDPEQKLALSRHLGTILGDKLHRDNEAWASWQAVLAQDPRSAEALRALLPLALARAAWADYVALARRLLPLETGDAALALRLALLDVLVDGLGARAEAQALAEEIGRTAATAAALDRAAAALGRAEAWEPALRLLAAAAAAEPDPASQLGRQRRRMELSTAHLGAAAAAPACEAVLALDPGDAAAHAALAALARGGGQWRRLVALHEAYLPHAPAAATPALLAEIREIYAGPLGERDLAFMAACRACHAQPGDAATMDRAETLAAAVGALEALVGVLEDGLAALAAPAAQRDVLRRIAKLQAGPLADAPAAEATLERLLGVAPDDLAALQALGALAAADERPDKQLAALERQLPLLPDAGARAAMLAEMAALYATAVGDAEAALACWQRAATLAPADDAIAAGTAAALFGLGRGAEWAALTRQRIARAPTGAAAMALRVALAERLEGSLADPEGATAAWAEVRAQAPDDAAALAALERLYAAAARFGELRALLADEATRAATPAQRARLWTKVARIDAEALGRPADAVACLEAAFAEAPDDLAIGRELARLLRAQRAFPRLAEVLAKVAALTPEGPARAEVDVALGELWVRELGRVDRAEQHFLRARAQAPTARAACHALGTLYERSGNWQQALEMLAAEAEIVGAGADALPLWLRVGRIHEDMLLDRAQAKAAYDRALTIDPSDAPALAARREMARADQEWDRYIALLTVAAEAEPDPAQRAELWVEAAHYARDVAADDGALEIYLRRALAAVPRQPAASQALAELLAKREAWDEALGHYAAAAAATPAGSPAAARLTLAMGRACTALGRHDDAVAHFTAALAADAGSLAAAESLGAALVSLGRWEEAQRVVGRLLLEHRDALTAGEQVGIETQMGVIAAALAAPERALGHFARALELAPAHLPALEGQAALAVAAGDWEAAARTLERVAAAAPEAARPAAYRRLAVVARDHLADLPRARDALERARRGGDVSAGLWAELGELEAALGQGGRAVDALEAAAAATPAETDAAARAALLLRAAELAESLLGNQARAVARYADALDLQPRLFGAFAAIERILAGRGAWAPLEAHTRAMLGRAGDFSPPMRAALWRSLAEINRRHLHDPAAAIAAYEVAQRLDPGVDDPAEIMAELYGRTAATRPKAIAMWHARAAASPGDSPVPALRALRRLHQAAGDLDASFVVAEVLVFLRAADADEQALVTQLRRRLPARAAHALTEDGWRALWAAGVAGPLGELAAALVRATPDLLTAPAKDLGLRPRDQLDVRGSSLAAAALTRQAAATLGLPPLALYRRPGVGDPLRLVAARPLALVAGETHPLFAAMPPAEALFHLGRSLAYARPELFLARTHPGESFRDLLLGACCAFGRDLQHPGDPRAVGRWAAAFARLPAATLAPLRGPAQAALPALLAPGAPASFAAAVECTAVRAGLLVAGDLAAAARAVGEGGDGAAALAPRERVRDLALFAASPAYLGIRRAIGAAIGTAAPGSPA